MNCYKKITVDDLITEYIAYKVKNGYEPSFRGKEFIEFVNYFQSLMEVSSYDVDTIFESFLNKPYVTYLFDRTNSHIDIEYENDDRVFKANYKLSDFNLSLIGTYFMDKDMVDKVRTIIGEYLKDMPKRKIDVSKQILDENLMVGKYVSSEIVSNIWNAYVRKNVENHTWPRQCNDICTYLLEMDLAKIIGLESKREEILQLYYDLARRIGIMYQDNKDLKITSTSGSYLAKANYDLIIKGYEQLVGYAIGEFKSSLGIDLSNLSFTESHRVGGVFFWDEDVEVKSTTERIDNNRIKKLVMKMDKYIK